MDIKRATGAILVESKKPLIVDEFEMPDRLAAGQVLVRVLHTSICGAQINEIDAVKGPDRWLPHLLGHEASAQVLEVGEGVSTVKPGDTVVMHWRPSAGIQSATPKYSWRGETLNAGWVTTFNTHSIVSENRLTVIDPGYDLKTAPLLGCAVTTALGVINNDAKVGIGESVVVFGAGGVGLNLVQFAAMVGAYPVVAVDLVGKKLKMAKSLGATHTVDASGGTDVAAAIKAIVGEKGADKVIDSTGVKQVIEMAYELTHPDGACVLVGVPLEKVTIYTLPLHFNKVLTGSEGGSCVPDRDIPRIIRLDEAGKLDLSGLITHEFPLEEINAALDTVRSGEAGRVLVSMEGA